MVNISKKYIMKIKPRDYWMVTIIGFWPEDFPGPRIVLNDRSEMRSDAFVPIFNSKEKAEQFAQSMGGIVIDMPISAVMDDITPRKKAPLVKSKNMTGGSIEKRTK